MRLLRALSETRLLLNYSLSGVNHTFVMASLSCQNPNRTEIQIETQVLWTLEFDSIILVTDSSKGRLAPNGDLKWKNKPSHRRSQKHKNSLVEPKEPNSHLQVSKSDEQR